MSSCSDFLDRYPVDALSPSTFWQTEDDAYLAMVGCYNRLEPIYGGYNMMYWDTTSDNLFNYFSWEGYKPIASGNMQTSDTGTSFFNFLDIRSCNEYLANEATVDWSTTEKQNQYKAEVRTLRAMFYFWKTEQYGDFPFFTDVLETPEEAQLARTDVATIREFIVSELKECIPHLPNKNGTAQGRINKQAAEALLMRYYLYQGDYTNALTYAKSIHESGQFAMPAMSYADAFLVANQYNSETILSHSYLESTSNDLYLPPFMPNMIGGWSSVVPTVDLVESYEMSDGRTIEEAKRDGDYDESNPFINRDPRLRASVLYPGQIYHDNYKNTYSGCYNSLLQYFANGDKNDDYGINADNASKTGLQVKKFLQNLDQFSDVNTASLHFPIFRYAEVLLTIAECHIELNQNLSEAIECINRVRNRAGMPNVDTGKYADQSSLRTLVRRERRVEFAGEGLRRADLKRWGLLTSTLAGFDILRYDGDVTTTLNADGDYNVAITGKSVVSGETYNFKSHNELLPVPLTQMELNPNLVQNPGY
ncbi:RagB/SusD family nutrient uptake outer membrane protein [Parabacteroides sp. PF5-6]|uniref:RagB/SusD family nutrient uptake outer membrane protein n=1 Tax=Parabacteroides sp. PF5-6 TaxID=1742403 RepID=UPI002407215D|nr:RagB/SusD family nutrient uptake outer membrane protein [Parabacteroides sp. PF5-6]